MARGGAKKLDARLEVQKKEEWDLLKEGHLPVLELLLKAKAEARVATPGQRLQPIQERGVELLRRDVHEPELAAPRAPLSTPTLKWGGRGRGSSEEKDRGRRGRFYCRHQFLHAGLRGRS